MSITFEGEPPFQLPLLQRSEADAIGNIVRVTLHVLDAGKGLIHVQIEMTLEVRLRMRAIGRARRLGHDFFGFLSRLSSFCRSTMIRCGTGGFGCGF